MVKKIALAVVPLTLLLIGGCAGVNGTNNLGFGNPFAGVYNGTLTYTQSSTNEPLTLNVSNSGHISGTYVDPVLGEGSLSGSVNSTGGVAGTTLANGTTGTFNFTLTSASTNHFTGSGTFTANSTANAVTLDVTRS